MNTPVTIIISIDGSKELQKYASEISQFIEKAIDTFAINDDLGSIIITNTSQSVFPLVILRQSNQKTLKGEIIRELNSIGDSTSEHGSPSKILTHTLKLLKKRSINDQWRPVYVMLITDGNFDEYELNRLYDILPDKNSGSIYMDAYVFNKNRDETRDFTKAVEEMGDKVFSKRSVINIRGRIDIVKTLWYLRDSLKNVRNTVQVTDIRASLAKRRAPGHVRIPSVFKRS
jgi:hypothetical protein